MGNYEKWSLEKQLVALSWLMINILAVVHRTVNLSDLNIFKENVCDKLLSIYLLDL